MIDAGQVGTRDALLPRRLARARRRADVHRLAQPQGLHRREARARGRDRAVGRRRHPGHPPGTIEASRARAASRARRRRGTRRGGRHLRGVPGGGAALHRRRRGALRGAAEGRARRRQRHGGPDGRAAARAPGARADRDLLDAGRQLPRPRAQPAAAREPRADHRAGARQRRRPRASPGTATPTAASSSTTRASSSTATSSPRCWPSRCSRKPPRAEAILYDVRASRAVPDTVTSGRRARLRQPRRARLLQDAHAQGGLAVRRRGLRALLLPRLLLRGLGHDPGAADARAARARAASACPSCWRPTASATSSPARSTPRSPTRRRRWRRSPSATPTRARTRLDGISIDYEDWHFNVRSSNTEPLLRLCLESLVSPEDMERRRDEVLALIRS